MPAVSFTDAIPNHVSVEEHRALTGATPTSFSDIPPVLRQKVDNVRLTFDPSLDGFSPEDGALGTLYIIESVLVYQSSTGRTLQIEYPAIALHATSRGDSAPYVYCQIDEPPAADAPSPDADDALISRVLMLTPQDPASLDPIFEALSYCASLHPDPQGSDDEEGEDDDDDRGDAFTDPNTTAFEVFTGDEGEELSEVGRVRSAPTNDNRYQPY